jgi:hypothetical protein
MITMFRFVRVALSSLLVLALASSAIASCLPGALRTTAEMACCQRGQHDCGQAMRAADCCKLNTSTAEKFVGTKPVVSAKPVLALSYLAFVVPIAPTRASGRTLVLNSASSSPPLFLLATTLRI